MLKQATDVSKRSMLEEAFVGLLLTKTFVAVAGVQEEGAVEVHQELLFVYLAGHPDRRRVHGPTHAVYRKGK